MDRTWIDPRDGKEWRVRFTWTGNGAMWVPLDYRGPPRPSAPVAVFFHPADPGTAREMLSVDRRGDEDLDTMTDQELMDLLDEAIEATPRTP